MRPYRFPALTLLLLICCLSLSGPLVAGDWADDLIYFVILDRYADGDAKNNRDVDTKQKGTFHGGDLAGLIQNLDEIADLGVTALWITPIVKQIDKPVDGAGFPDWAYHGYWADDFTRMEPRFGTEAELKALVDQCHQRGIKVLLDVVYNHAGYQSSYTKAANANDWMRTGRRESLCGDDDLTQCLSGLPDFKTEKPEVAKYLMDAHLGLAKRVGLDGFRLDTVKHVDHPFWQEHRTRTKAELGKDFFLLGEVWGGDQKVLDPWFSGDELDAGFDFTFKGSTQAFVEGRGRTVAYSRYLQKRHQVREGHLLSHYLSSHDETGTLAELKGNLTLFRLAATLQMTTSGIPMIFYGEEVGRKIGAWPFNRSDMPWGERKTQPGAGVARDEELRTYYQKLIKTRRAHKALSRGDYQEISSSGEVLVFARSVEQDLVWVVVNRGSETAQLELALPPIWSGKPVSDALGQTTVTLAANKLSLSLAGQSASILEVSP